MIAYFDTSALVKLVIEEMGTDIAETIWRTAPTIVANQVGEIEFHSALGTAITNRRIPTHLKGRSKARVRSIWTQVRPVALDDRVTKGAKQVGFEHGLRTLDAIHLASALTIEPRPVMVSWDRRLREASERAGLALAPAQL